MYILVQLSPPKIQKLDHNSTGIQMNNLMSKHDNELKTASQSNLPSATNNEEGESGIRSSVSNRVVGNEGIYKK